MLARVVAYDTRRLGEPRWECGLEAPKAANTQLVQITLLGVGAPQCLGGGLLSGQGGDKPYKLLLGRAPSQGTTGGHMLGCPLCLNGFTFLPL